MARTTITSSRPAADCAVVDAARSRRWSMVPARRRVGQTSRDIVPKPSPTIQRFARGLLALSSTRLTGLRCAASKSTRASITRAITGRRRPRGLSGRTNHDPAGTHALAASAIGWVAIVWPYGLSQTRTADIEQALRYREPFQPTPSAITQRRSGLWKPGPCVTAQGTRLRHGSPPWQLIRPSTVGPLAASTPISTGPGEAKKPAPLRPHEGVGWLLLFYTTKHREG